MRHVRQEEQPAANVTLLSDDEAKREISNCNVFRFMDLVNILAMLYVVANSDPCQEPYKHWIIGNSIVAFFSLSYLTWWVNAQLAYN